MMPQDEISIRQFCAARLERTLKAIIQIEHPGVFAMVRGEIWASSNLNMAQLRIESIITDNLQRHPGNEIPPYMWRSVPTDLRSYIEMTFFRRDFSRHSLRRLNLFNTVKEAIKTDELTLAAPSAHDRIKLHSDIIMIETGNPA